MSDVKLYRIGFNEFGHWDREATPADAVEAFGRKVLADEIGVGDLLIHAWGVIVNAGGGDWTQETEEWREAALRWRDLFHAYLDAERREGER